MDPVTQALLQLAPELISLGQNVVAWLNKVGIDDPKQFATDLGDAFAKLSAAQTQEDKQNAAQNLANCFARL